MTGGVPIGLGMPDGFDGKAYQERFDALERSGRYLHGEADFVMSFAPESVLDAGCGTGRVALELARRGVLVVGVDRDQSMLAVAGEKLDRARADSPGLRLSYEPCDLVDLDLGVTFDIVVMAGNVLHFSDRGTERVVVSALAAHVRPGGVLVAGFELGRRYGLDDYDRHSRAAGLELAARYSTWEGEAFDQTSGYAVSVHRRP